MRHLLTHQQEAVDALGNGRILYGGVGSGKSATAIAYYMKNEADKDVYVITTAKKRDSREWLGEAAHFGVGEKRDGTVAGVITIDSWNNLEKYTAVQNAFFIFDEQRLVGNGAWVKAFIRIVRSNRWILLSATPGDTWLDYAPVFVANGFYGSLSEFKRRHVVYAPFIKFPKVIGYINEAKLHRLRNEILVEMPYLKTTERFVNYLDVGYDEELVKKIQKERWHYLENRPIENIAELWRYVRMVINSDPSRLETVRDILRVHPRLIIFYNFNYELEILRTLRTDFNVAEWNGQRHDSVPSTADWIYLVQYSAGAEGWNCTATDAMLFYSLTYSYKNWIQAQGRIDRLDTKYKKLYYYVLKSSSYIDSALRIVLAEKKDFNERRELLEWQESELSGE